MMTLNTIKKMNDYHPMVLFPRFIPSLAALFFLASISSAALAEMPPHGRPGNLKTLPGFSIGAAGGAGNNAINQFLYIEAKFSHRFMVILESNNGTSEQSDIAFNGDLDTESSGVTGGLYYQLPLIRNTHLTLAVRSHNNDTSEDEIILSGASRVVLAEESDAIEVALLAEHASWAKGNWQPYVGLGFRQTDRLTDINTTGGREIMSNELTENTGEFTAGLHYQRNKFSWFLEGNASSADDLPWQLHLGLRYGFFHRLDN